MLNGFIFKQNKIFAMKWKKEYKTEKMHTCYM